MVFSWNIMVGWRFPQDPLIKMSLPQAIVPWRSTVIQKGCVALRWLQRIDACHAMITFPVRGTFLGMCCLFFFFGGGIFWINGFFWGFWVAKKSMDLVQGTMTRVETVCFFGKKCYGLPVIFHSSNLVLWWLMFFFVIDLCLYMPSSINHIPAIINLYHHVLFKCWLVIAFLLGEITISRDVGMQRGTWYVKSPASAYLMWRENQP